MTIIECIELQNCAYIACLDEAFGWIKSEIQPSDYWVGGDKGGYTNDSNIYFNTPEQAEKYYNQKYVEVHVFDDEFDCEDFFEDKD